MWICQLCLHEPSSCLFLLEGELLSGWSLDTGLPESHPLTPAPINSGTCWVLCQVLWGGVLKSCETWVWLSAVCRDTP